MKNGRPQCKDIPERPILELLAHNPDKWHTWGTGYYMVTVQDAMPEGTPPKLQLAKMRSLMRRGLVGGCGCGCRGDFAITESGCWMIGLDPFEVEKFSYY